MGQRHLTALRRINGVKVLAIPKHPERIREIEKAGYLIATDLRSAVRLGAGLCVIASDTGQHVEDGMAAVEQGFEVLVEKPLGVDAVEADRLSKQARTVRRRLFVGCVLRFSRSLQVFRELLGCLKRLHSIRIECQSYLPEWRPSRPYGQSYSARRNEGGVLRDLIHEIDYAGWLFGWPVALQARIRNLGWLGIEAEEAAELAWETPDGCMVSLRLDYLSRPPCRTMRASGEMGTLEWDGIAGTVNIALAGEPAQVIPASETHEEMLFAQDRAFVEACSGEMDPRLATGEDGVKALAVCDAARRASDSSREEPVEYPYE